jgi:release factor glutamine methyltransferase
VNGSRPPASTVGAALDRARPALQQSESGPLEAQVLLAHLLDRPRDWILSHPEAPLQKSLAIQFSSLIRRAAEGEPLAYLTGRQEFFGLNFEVTPDVLIPRPETELLVDAALHWLASRRKGTSTPSRQILAVDLGTGCGCIAAALAVHAAELRVMAADISARALTVAARNCAALGVSDRVHLLQADLLAPLRGPIDLLCANLPYIPAGALDILPVVRYEPRIALDGGPDGLRLIARALGQSAPLLAAGGLALFEIEAQQANVAHSLADKYFPDLNVSIKKDLAGKDRLLQILRPN